MGSKLLDRTPRGVRLTDSGRVLVAHADAILSRLESAEDELAELAGLRGGRLRLASFQSAGATLIPRGVAASHARYPKVELGMVEAEPEEANALLRSGDIDLALVYDYAVVPGTLGAELETEHLIDDVYDAVLPKEHALAAKPRLTMTDLGTEPWVGPTDRSGCRLIVDRACQEAGYDARIAFEADETMAAQALVAADFRQEGGPALSSCRDRRGRLGLLCRLGARLACLEQPLAQVALVLGRGVEARHVGEGVEGLEAEQLLKEVGGAIEHCAEARAARLLDQTALEQRAGGRFRRHTAHPRYLGSRDRL